jgi:hypothetical protein
MDILQYITLFRELSFTSADVMKSLYGGLEKYKNSLDGFGDIKDSKKSDVLLNFQFLGFNIWIELKICTLKEVVFIEWYLDDEDFSDSDRQKTLIIKDTVDRNSNIKSSMIKDKEYNILYAKIYFAETLLTFCEKIDEIEFNKSIQI